MFEGFGADHWYPDRRRLTSEGLSRQPAGHGGVFVGDVVVQDHVYV